MQKAMQRRVPWFPILLAIGWMVMTGYAMLDMARFAAVIAPPPAGSIRAAPSRERGIDPAATEAGPAAANASPTAAATDAADRPGERKM